MPIHSKYQNYIIDYHNNLHHFLGGFRGFNSFSGAAHPVLFLFRSPRATLSYAPEVVALE